MNSDIKHLHIGAALLFVIMSYVGLMHYSGFPLVYGGFCLLSIVLLLDAVYKPAGLTYSFLVIFLSLGFWTKVTLHLWLGYAYLEPIGLFDHTPASWDEVLTVSTVGLAGVMLGKALFMRYTKPAGSTATLPLVPDWYSSARNWLWSMTFIAIIGIPYLNWSYGLAQIGIIPKTLLPWPLNGLTAWLLGFGLIAWVLTLAGWDHTQRRHWATGYIATLTEGLFSTASCLSRAIFLFHTAPYMIVLFAKRVSLKPYRKCILALTTWTLLFLVSMVVVMGLRYGSDSPVRASSNQSLNTSKPNEFFLKLTEKTSLLIVDRWIGIEGVMAVSAYPDKNSRLLELAFFERRVRGQMDFYTSKIALVDLSEDDRKVFQYASIPGGIAFFYYSGSLLLVFFGMAVMVLVLMASERLVLIMTRNPYLCAFWGMGGAQIVASFGLGIMQQLVYSGFCLLVLGFIGLIQRTSIKRKPLTQV
jgi:hypothetical protein